MSDLKLFNLKTNQLLKHNKKDKINIKDFIEQNSVQLLGIEIIFSNYEIFENQQIQTLGYDENKQLVIIEYRNGKFSSTVNKGLVYLDYIKDNHSKIKSVLIEKLGIEIVKNINMNPRLISIGDDYNQYDEYAIKQMPYTIDLIKYQIFENKFLLLEKSFQSTKVENKNTHDFLNDSMHKLYNNISDFILSLGDEVCEVNNKNYICYRKIKNFIYIVFNNYFELKIKTSTNYKTIIIKNYNDFLKSQYLIEKCYDEN